MQRRLMACVLLLTLFFTGCQEQTKVNENIVTKEIFAMDTMMQLTLYGEQAGNAMNEATQLIHRYDTMFSVTNANSDVAKLNAASGAAVTVSEETYELVQKSISLSKETEGLFDISIYPLVKAWGFTTDSSQVPSTEVRAEALKKVDYTKIQLLPENQIEMEKDMEIDLGAVAKGYLSHKLMELFKENHVEAALVSLGGNVQTYGKKEDGSSFRVGITNPADGSSIYGIINVENKAVVTSGIYQRNFTENGTMYHHIMDKRTGMPAENTLASVTVIAEDGARADALATALYVMGEEKAKEYQKQHAEIDVILIRKDGSSWQSEGVDMDKNQ